MPSPQRRTGFDKTPGVTWRIHRIHQDHEELMDDRVVIEEPLEILVNGKSIAVLMRLPGQEKELAAGFCITEGYVRKAQDILLIHHCGLGLPGPGEDENPAGGESRNRIELSVEPAGLLSLKPADFVRLIRSGCGAADVTATAESLPTVSQEFSVEPSLLLRFSKAMRDLQAVHHEVGGTHSAVLFDTNGHVVHLAEDIGRHNAVDKVVGYCLLRKIPLRDKMLLTSGRASYEMATKAIRAGIPLIATLSAPTSLAAEIARDRGLTLVGYLRGGRMNVYTHRERLRR
jgi:FdhD protein